MRRALLCVLLNLLPVAWTVASDYNYDINYYNDYELFDKGYQYEDHDHSPEYVNPYTGSYDEEVSIPSQGAVDTFLSCRSIDWENLHSCPCKICNAYILILGSQPEHCCGAFQMYGEFFEDHEAKTADCRIDKDGAPKFNGAPELEDHQKHSTVCIRIFRFSKFKPAMMAWTSWGGQGVSWDHELYISLLVSVAFDPVGPVIQDGRSRVRKDCL